MKKFLTIMFAIIAMTASASFHSSFHSSSSIHPSYHPSYHSTPHYSSPHVTRPIRSSYTRPTIHSSTDGTYYNHNVSRSLGRTYVKDYTGNRTGSYIHTYPSINANHVIMYYLLFHNHNTGKIDTVKSTNKQELEKIVQEDTTTSKKEEGGSFFYTFLFIFGSGILLLFGIRWLLRR